MCVFVCDNVCVCIWVSSHVCVSKTPLSSPLLQVFSSSLFPDELEGRLGDRNTMESPCIPESTRPAMSDGWEVEGFPLEQEVS